MGSNFPAGASRTAGPDGPGTPEPYGSWPDFQINQPPSYNQANISLGYMAELAQETAWQTWALINMITPAIQGVAGNIGNWLNVMTHHMNLRFGELFVRLDGQNAILSQTIHDDLQAIARNLAFGGAGGGTTVNFGPLINEFRQQRQEVVNQLNTLTSTVNSHVSSPHGGGTGGAATDITPLVDALMPIPPCIKEITDQLSAMRAHELNAVFQQLFQMANSLGRMAFTVLPQELRRIADGLVGGPVFPETVAFAQQVGVILPRGPTLEQVRTVFDTALEAFVRGVSGLWDRIKGLPKDQYELMLDFYTPLVEKAIGAGPELASRVTDIAVDSFGALGAKIIDTMRQRLAGIGVVAPGDQTQVSQDLLGQALTLGIEAHLLSVGSELLLPTKRLGFGQLAALMVDLASFRTIADAELGTQIEAAIEVPARAQANETFRSFVPPAFLGILAHRKRDISTEDFEQILRWNGYPPWFMEPTIRGSYQEPDLDEIRSFTDDIGIDADWLRRKLERSGFNDEDTDVLLDVSLRNGTKSMRVAYQVSLMSAFRDGSIDQVELESELELMRVSPEGQELIIRRALLERRREFLDLHEQTIRKLAEEQAISVDEYRASLIAFGMEPDVAGLLAAKAEAKIEARLFATERRDVEKAIRAEQTNRIRALREAFRKGLLTRSQLTTGLALLGLLPTQADAVASLEEVRRSPTPRKPTVRTQEAQRQIENRLILTNALLAFRKGQIDEQRTDQILASVGVPLLERLGLLERERLRTIAPPTRIGKEEPSVRKARQLHTDSALAEFRQGKINQEALETRLTALGHAEEVAAGFVAREIARVPAPNLAEEDVPGELSAEDRRIRKLTEQTARELFRAGLLSDAEAVELIVKKGTTRAVAEGIIQLEQARAAR